MFFKSSDKPEPTEQNVSPLFSMEQIGLQIMNARKKKGMTQMELADRMGISFQAVSNWERGLSCPDISKLFELSELFDVSIDELLGNRRAAQIATEIQDGTPPALPVEELTAVAPLLDQEQADQVMQKSLLEESEEAASAQTEKSIYERIQMIESLLPYASREVIDDLAASLLQETKDPEKLVAFAPYMSRESISRLARTFLEETHDLATCEVLMPFVNRETAREIAKAFLEQTQDPEEINALLPFLSREAIGEYAHDLLEKTHDLGQIQHLLPFMNRSGVDHLIRTYLG